MSSEELPLADSLTITAFSSSHGSTTPHCAFKEKAISAGHAKNGKITTEHANNDKRANEAQTVVLPYRLRFSEIFLTN